MPLAPGYFDGDVSPFEDAIPPDRRPIARPILEEIVTRLDFMQRVGLDYLTLDRPAGSLRLAEIKRLRSSIVQVMRASIDQGGTTFRDFRNGYNKSGEFQKMLQVYGKTDGACNTCGKAIKKVVIGGRSAHFCEHCQK